MWRAFSKVAPQVEVVVRLKAYICVFIFFSTAFRWACHLSLESNCTPRIRTTDEGAIVLPCICSRAAKSKPRLRVKCVSLYLCGAKRIPCVEAHFRHRSCANSRAAQFSVVDLLYTRRLTSSAKPIADSRGLSWLSALSSSAL